MTERGPPGDDVVDGRPPTALSWWRGIVFFAAAAYIVGGPFVNQIVLDRPIAGVPSWRMFADRSLAMCELNIVERSPDGEERALDWVALLKRDRFAVQPSHVPSSRRAAQELALQLCAKPGEPPRDVRVHRRCADRAKGWRIDDNGDTDVCAPGAVLADPPPAPPRRRGRP